MASTGPKQTAGQLTSSQTLALPIYDIIDWGYPSFRNIAK